MSSFIEVRLFGSLRENSEGRDHHHVPIGPGSVLSLGELLDRLGILAQGVRLAMVNARAAVREQMIKPGDRVALFPEEYAIFADWKNFRA